MDFKIVEIEQTLNLGNVNFEIQISFLIIRLYTNILFQKEDYLFSDF